MDSDSLAFLRAEFWMLSWNASVQRAVKRRKGATDGEKVQLEKAWRGFRQELLAWCEADLLSGYADRVSESRHVQNLFALRDKARQLERGELLQQAYTLGVAQKLVNLHLKYLWCLGVVAMPPHCPVDRIILRRTRLKESVSWSRIDSLEEYMSAIDAVRDAAGGGPIAAWELRSFSRPGDPRLTAMRGRVLEHVGPGSHRATGVRITAETLSVDLADGRTISAPLVWFPRLADASEAQRARWEFCGGGEGIHWPDVDEDVSVEGLLRGAPAPGHGRATGA